MADAAEALLAAEVEPFPLTADLVHMLFHLRLPTVNYIPVGLVLQVRDAWITKVRAVPQQPRDDATWVRLLLFWHCVFSTFRPVRASERRASAREPCQRSQITHFL